MQSSILSNFNSPDLKDSDKNPKLRLAQREREDSKESSKSYNRYKS